MPSLTRWFHPINLVQAEALLKAKGRVGSFLVRPSGSNPRDFTLSLIVNDSKIYHIKIQNAGDYYDCYAGHKFGTLAELIQYYHEHPGELKERGGDVLRIDYPIYNEITSVRWYHGGISGKQAEAVISGRGGWVTSVPNGCYLVRDSRSRPGDLLISVKDHNQIYHLIIRSMNGQFDLKGGNLFDTVEDLIAHYSKHCPVNTSGQVIHLEQPVNSSRFIALLTELENRMKELSKKSNLKQYSHESGYFEEFDILQNKEKTVVHPQEGGTRKINSLKNGQEAVLPYDHSRVILQYPGDGSDYINASYIAGEKMAGRMYIATQACLDDTMGDFWMMIWEQKCHVIIMLTKEVDRGKRQCTRYWPDATTGDWEFGDMTIVSIEDLVYSNSTVRKFQIKKKGHPEILDVWQYQYTSWPARGVPVEPSDFMDFLLEARVKSRDYSDDCPVLVHGRNGIGRTGTIIVIDIIFDLIKYYGLEQELDIMKTVHLVRSQRSGLVQTVEQYQFIYLVVHCYVETMTEQLESERDSKLTQIKGSKEKFDEIDLSHYDSLAIERQQHHYGSLESLDNPGYIDMSKCAINPRNYEKSPYEYMAVSSSYITTDFGHEDLSETGMDEEGYTIIRFDNISDHRLPNHGPSASANNPNVPPPLRKKNIADVEYEDVEVGLRSRKPAVAPRSSKK